LTSALLYSLSLSLRPLQLISCGIRDALGDGHHITVTRDTIFYVCFRDKERTEQLNSLTKSGTVPKKNFADTGDNLHEEIIRFCAKSTADDYPNGDGVSNSSSMVDSSDSEEDSSCSSGRMIEVDSSDSEEDSSDDSAGPGCSGSKFMDSSALRRPIRRGKSFDSSSGDSDSN